MLAQSGFSANARVVVAVAELAIEVAVEQYVYWRDVENLTIYEMIQAIGNGAGPEDTSGDSIIYWLAQIWDTQCGQSEA